MYWFRLVSITAIDSGSQSGLCAGLPVASPKSRNAHFRSGVPCFLSVIPTISKLIASRQSQIQNVKSCFQRDTLVRHGLDGQFSNANARQKIDPSVEDQVDSQKRADHPET